MANTPIESLPGYDPAKTQVIAALGGNYVVLNADNLGKVLSGWTVETVSPLKNVSMNMSQEEHLRAFITLVIAMSASVSAGADTDVSAYLTAIGVPNDGTVYYPGTAQQITGAQIWTAVTNFIAGLKGDGTYPLIDHLLLMIGGTAAAHKIDFKNPTGSGIDFLGGGWVHSGTGAKPNGTTSYANTHISAAGLVNVLLSYFARNYTPGHIGGLLAAISDGNNSMQFYTSTNTGTPGALVLDCFNASAGRLIDTLGAYTGLITATRTSPTSFALYKNDTQLMSGNTAGGTAPNLDIYLAAENNGGTPVAFSDQECALAAISSSGFSQGQMTLFNARVAALQTALHRNV